MNNIYIYISHQAHECKILQLRISKLKKTRMHIRNYLSILRLPQLRGIVVFRFPCLRPVKGWYDLATTGSSHDPRRSARPGVTGHATQQRDAVSCRNEGCSMMRARVPSGHKHPTLQRLETHKCWERNSGLTSMVFSCFQFPGLTYGKNA